MDQYGNFLHFPLGSYRKHQQTELGRHYLFLMRYLWNVGRIIDTPAGKRTGPESKVYTDARMYYKAKHEPEPEPLLLERIIELIWLGRL